VTPPVDDIYDVIILGAGPAGLSAALFSARAGLSVMVMGSESGMLSETPYLENYPSWHANNGHDDTNKKDDMGGTGWLSATREQAVHYGTSFAPSGLITEDVQAPMNVNSSDGDNGWFTLTTQQQKAYKSWSVIIATGATSRKLNLPNEDKLWGKSIHSCAICDGPMYKNASTVIVVGGGDSAVDAAVLLSRYVHQVVLIHRRDSLSKASNQMAVDLLPTISNVRLLLPYQVMEWRTTRGSDGNHERLEAVRVVHANDPSREEIIRAEGAFVMIGATPNTDMLQGMLDLDNDGLITLQPDQGRGQQSTSLPGVFAAGEVCDAVYRQAVTAAAAGAMAAMDVQRWLTSVRGTSHTTNRRVNHHHLAPPPPPAAAAAASSKIVLKQEKMDCDLASIECIQSLITEYPVVIFSKHYCPYCQMAIEAIQLELSRPQDHSLFTTHVKILDLSSMEDGYQIQQTLAQFTGRRTVPNVFIHGNNIGGGDEIVALHREGKLELLLMEAGAMSL